MNLENLKENIRYEREIIREIFIFRAQLEQARFLGNSRDEKIINDVMVSLLNLLNMTNNSIPGLLSGVEPEVKPEIKISEIKPVELKVPEKKTVKKTKIQEEKTGLVRVGYNAPTGRTFVTIKEEEKNRFIQDLSLSLKSIKKLKKGKRIEEKEGVRLFKKPSAYARFSNRFFSNYSNSLVNKGKFKNINMDMRKANMLFLLNTYISMALMTALIGLVAGIFIFIFLIFFKVDLSFPFFHIAEFNIFRILLNFLFIPGIPLAILGGFYIYPGLEKRSMEKRINQELPFVVIHMSAIAGSGVEPSQIFRIIAMESEYKYTRQELKKVINQVNVYGYDLVNSLKNAARSSSSKKISELFNGLATTISSGGKLIDFLDKRAETLLFDYRLERERFTRTAETFMDIYISVVIAAPMIMMLMLVLISISGIGIGLPISALGIIVILIVALINIVFLFVLHLKQPTY